MLLSVFRAEQIEPGHHPFSLPCPQERYVTMYLALSTYPSEALDKRSQHLNATSPSIVGRLATQPRGVGCYWLKVDLSQTCATAPNMSKLLATACSNVHNMFHPMMCCVEMLSSFGQGLRFKSSLKKGICFGFALLRVLYKSCASLSSNLE